MSNSKLQFKIQNKILIAIFIALILGLILFGYFRATPSTNQKDTPKIEVIPKFFDFGEVRYGNVLEHSFNVKNLGNKVLKIKRVATSCACTTAWVSKKILNPGESAVLFVRYDTSAMSGPISKGEQERFIWIQSNDEKEPQVEVLIRAFVK